MTAVEWFIEKTTESGHLWMTDKPNDMLELTQLIEQAKQMEREQSEQICLTVFERILDKMEKGETVKSKDIFEQYYNQTYGK